MLRAELIHVSDLASDLGIAKMHQTRVWILFHIKTAGDSGGIEFAR